MQLRFEFFNLFNRVTVPVGHQPGRAGTFRKATGARDPGTLQARSRSRSDDEEAGDYGTFGCLCLRQDK